MKPIEFWYWHLRDPVAGTLSRSACRLTEADARRRDPNAICVPGTCEVRVLPRHPDEYLPSFGLRSLRLGEHERRNTAAG